VGQLPASVAALGSILSAVTTVTQSMDVDGFAESDGPLATPLEAPQAVSSSSDDSDSCDDDDDTSSSEEDDSDDETDSDSDDDDEDDGGGSRAAAVPAHEQKGEFKGGAGAWLALGRGDKDTAEFDGMMREMLKEGSADATARVRSNMGNVRDVERRMESRLSINVGATARTATLADNAKALAKHHAAPQPDAAAGADGAAPKPAGIVKMTVLRRTHDGKGDSVAAKAMFVPAASAFVERSQAVRDAFAEEQQRNRQATLKLSHAATADEQEQERQRLNYKGRR
jgi:hypothetical protein